MQQIDELNALNEGHNKVTQDMEIKYESVIKQRNKLEEINYKIKKENTSLARQLQEFKF